MSEFSVMPGNADGLIFRTMEDGLQKNSDTWLDQQHKLRVESSYCIASETHKVFDLRVRIMDKTSQQFDITHLFDDAQVTTA